MRVLTYTNLIPNRVDPNFGVFVFQRLRHTARQRISIEIVAPVPYVPGFAARLAPHYAHIPETDSLDGLTVHYARYPLIPKVSMLAQARLMDLGTMRLVEKLHHEHAFDLIDAHYLYPDCVAAARIGKRLGIPVVMSARGSDVHQFFKMPAILRQIQKALKSSAAIVAVSNSLADQIRALPGVGEVQVIGNGVDTSRFHNIDQIEARKQLGLDPHSPVIVSVAALKPIKGHRELIRAFGIVRRQFPNALLLLVGKGTEQKKLEALCQSSGLADAVRFEGAVPNERLFVYYSAANVSCLASRNEGWPNVILESLACGTPVVATAVGGIPEALCSDAVGILTGVEHTSIATGLEQALSRTWDRAGILKYAQGHSWQEVGAEVAGVFQRVVDSTKK